MILGVILGIGAFFCALNGQWGPAAVCGVIAMACFFMSSEDRADYRAYRNRRDYWAYGKEPDWKQEKRERTTNAGMETFACDACGRKFLAKPERCVTMYGGVVFWKVRCTKCGKVKYLNNK